jgi:F-type H+-transporting ATPase subunit b
MSFDLSLLMIMVCFWVAYVVIRKMFIEPLGSVLDDRTQRVEGARAKWEEKNADFESASEGFERELDEAARAAAQRRAELRHEAQAQRQQRLDAARQSADAKLSEALAQLDTEGAQAREQLRAEARQLSQLFASQLLGREVQS